MNPSTPTPEKRKRRGETKVVTSVTITPTHKYLMEQEASVTGKSISLIVREALDDRYKDSINVRRFQQD